MAALENSADQNHEDRASVEECAAGLFPIRRTGSINMGLLGAILRDAAFERLVCESERDIDVLDADEVVGIVVWAYKSQHIASSGGEK